MHQESQLEGAGRERSMWVMQRMVRELGTGREVVAALAKRFHASEGPPLLKPCCTAQHCNRPDAAFEVLSNGERTRAAVTCHPWRECPARSQHLVL